MKPLAAAIAWALIVLVPNSSRGMAIFGHPKDAASNQDSWDWRHDGIGADGASQSRRCRPNGLPDSRRSRRDDAARAAFARQRRLGNGARQRRQDDRRKRRRQAVLGACRARHNCHLVFAGVAARTASLAAPAKRSR